MVGHHIDDGIQSWVEITWNLYMLCRYHHFHYQSHCNSYPIERVWKRTNPEENGNNDVGTRGTRTSTYCWHKVPWKHMLIVFMTNRMFYWMMRMRMHDGLIILIIIMRTRMMCHHRKKGSQQRRKAPITTPRVTKALCSFRADYGLE